MARLVKHESKGPKKVEVGGEAKYMCMCGLSKDKPKCDGSHSKVQDEEEGETYVYDSEGNRTKVESQYE